MRQVRNFIAGRSVDAASGARLDLIEPATGLVQGSIPASAAVDVDAAVAAAGEALPAWRATPGPERSRLLLRLADVLDARLEEFARIESLDTGKPLALARTVDIPRSAANLRFFATAILHQQGELFETESPPASQAMGGTGVAGAGGAGAGGAGAGGGGAGGGGLARAGGLRALNYTLRRPRGVVGLISPWNLPLYLLTWKIAPALACGNTAVCKPSELTPSSASLLAEAAVEVGIPPGVLNIVHGRGADAGAAIVRHPGVAAISFTGSTGVGRWIGEQAGGQLKPVSLELGGKNPFIIYDDAALPEALDTAVRAAFANQGQICLCGARLLVQRGVFEHVLRGLALRAEALRVGDPLAPETQQGALISRAHLSKVDGLVRAARDLGGRIHAGGAPVDPSRLPERCRGGFFYSPTVISGLDPACRVEQEEIFGPVVTLQPFRDEDDAVSLANGTRYGLAATVFTQDLSRAHRTADRLEAGVVWVNCWMLRDLRTPFGGMKQSGVGREGGSEALHFFSEPKNVCVRI